ncbi:hypothetical protein LR48_Vigan11g154500 [Vigna angularis]|uniref:Polygalacturonase n=1 Tax=Phaseolus angularis TaxID=3914 RepID=A0A0L9VTW0_PHAAN|nr:hypothetical protein LR48_Vigan11g154500 [Vigna angularis]
MCGEEEPATLLIPSNKIFLVKRLNLNGPCKAPNVGIKFEGKIIAPSMNEWVGDSSTWIQIFNVNGLTIDGDGGIIDGNGSTWWETCITCRRPTSLVFQSCNGLTVKSLSMSNSPEAHIAVNGCDGAFFSHININSPPKSPNTDGFDIAHSKNIVIQDSTLATGDDCIAINGGSSYINATRLFCIGGHGISIGSLGRNKSYETVEEVHVQNCSFIGTTNGARIKTWPGGSGYARKITFEEIILQDAQNSIIIDQYYNIKTLSEVEDDAVRVSEVTYRGFNGTSASEKAINLNCSPSGCFNITLDLIYIVSSKSSKDAYAFCKNIVNGTIGSTVPKAISYAWQDMCGEEGPATLVIPSNKIFLVKRLNLNGPCKAPNVSIKFEGKIVAPCMDEWDGDSFSWIKIFYVNGLTIEADGGIIDGNGSTWWKKCRTCRRPTSLRFHSCNGLTVKSLSMSNSPGAHISVNGCNGALFSHININSPPKSPNTDGFDIANSKNIVIQDSTLATGDDCIAINGGSSYINATRLFCIGGHGISIGSLGRNKSYETVEEVHVQNCRFIGTTNGARIKTWPGGSGYARKIMFEEIILQDAKNSIIIDQYYGINTLSEVEDDAVRVSEVTYRGFNGTSASEKTINLNCSPSGCFNITLDQIYIVSSKSSKHVYAFCKNIVNGTIGSTVPKVSCQ